MPHSWHPIRSLCKNRLRKKARVLPCRLQLVVSPVRTCIPWPERHVPAREREELCGGDWPPSTAAQGHHGLRNRFKIVFFTVKEGRNNILPLPSYTVHRRCCKMSFFCCETRHGNCAGKNKNNSEGDLCFSHCVCKDAFKCLFKCYICTPEPTWRLLLFKCSHRAVTVSSVSRTNRGDVARGTTRGLGVRLYV